MELHTKTLIVGAGPTGLGAAHRLIEHGEEDWLVLERSNEAGGLAGSVIDECGFTWDLGGHVLFSHYEYFDDLLDDLLKDQWLFHKREASVWLYDQFIPYPFQNNIWRLPKGILVKCMDELMVIYKESNDSATPSNFKQWLESHYGRSLSEIFFFPYNTKVWACDPAEMSSVWIGERVARVSVPQIIKNIILQQDDIGWGPNAQFRFPLKGGTGALWAALAKRMPKEKLVLGAEVVAVDPSRKSVTLKDGRVYTFDQMISTMPLNILVSCLQGEPELAAKANQFIYSSCHIVGVGVEGPVPEDFANKFWMYFPDPEIPFYRVTVFSNYSPNNVARPDEQWSLLCEVSESMKAPRRDAQTVKDDVLNGLRKAKILTGAEKLANVWHKRLEHGYPTPFLGRDELLKEVETALRHFNILTRGRFGGWRYEVANQDHSLMQGVEAVDHLLDHTEEITYFFPDTINAGPKCKTRSIA